MTENDERPDNGGEGQSNARGRMRFQDGSTTPREPSLAEQRFRERAARQQEQALQRRMAQMQRSRKRRKVIKVGTWAAVGVVALVALGYLTAEPEEQVVAHCVDEDGIIVDDSNCVTPASSSTTYYGGGGFYPVFIGSGGRQYHYTYGGTGTIGQRVQGGTTVVPKEGTRIVTSSGKTISRGGFGVSRGGSSSGS